MENSKLQKMLKTWQRYYHSGSMEKFKLKNWRHFFKLTAIEAQGLKEITQRRNEIEPEMMDEDSSVARIDELGNQVHNLSCFQDDEYLSEKLDAVAMTLWELAQQSCH